MFTSYRDFFTTVRDTGLRRDSRYGMTAEKIAPQFQFDAGDLFRRPGVNFAIGWQELLQLIAGEYDKESFRRVAPKSNVDLFTAKMAYGPRVTDQIPKILEAIHDPDARRQLVAFVGGEQDGPTSDLPCTETIQFLPSGDRLRGIVSMRSWDLCKGFPYDAMMFGGLVMAVARCSSLRPSQVIVTAGSAHVYESEFDKTPTSESRLFYFNDEVPKEWNALKVWARQYKHLESYETPRGIEVVK